MMLETIAKTYGMTDYLDMNTYRIYMLSMATYDKVSNETVVPVVDNFTNNLIGVCRMAGDWVHKR